MLAQAGLLCRRAAQSPTARPRLPATRHCTWPPGSPARAGRPTSAWTAPGRGQPRWSGHFASPGPPSPERERTQELHKAGRWPSCAQRRPVPSLPQPGEAHGRATTGRERVFGTDRRPSGPTRVFSAPGGHVGVAARKGEANGRDGALWSTNSGDSTIGRITTGGPVTIYT